MVVLRLVGDTWSYMDRLAVAIKPMEPFKGRLAEIQKTLGLESFVGWAIYRTEGAHPHLIRPTTPIDVASNLTKEKLAVGAQVVVYIKQADLDRQANDVTFHNGLLHYRQEHGIKAVAKDGSDVKAFIEDLSTRLNITDSADIAEHEAELRGRIEGEAHRIYWVITSEFREIQELKDEETAARGLLLGAYTEGLSVLYTTHVLLPRLEGRDETAGRRNVAAAFESSLAALKTEEQSERPAAPPPEPEAPPPAVPPPEPIPAPLPATTVVVSGGGMSKEDMEALVSTMQSLVTATQQQASAALEGMQKEFNTIVDALATDMRKSASELQHLRAVVQGTATTERDGALAIEREVAGRLERERLRVKEERARFEADRAMEVQQWMGPPRNAESAALAKRLLAEQNESLRALIDEEDAMVEQQCVAMRSLAQGYELGLYSEALNAVAVEQSVQSMQQAQTQLAMELERVSERLRAAEAAERRREEIAAAAAEAKAAAEVARLAAAKADRTVTVVTNGYCAVVGHRGIFSCGPPLPTAPAAVRAAAEGSAVEVGLGSRAPPAYPSLHPTVTKMLVLFITKSATAEELHFMVTGRDRQLGIVPTMAAVRRERRRLLLWRAIDLHAGDGNGRKAKSRATPNQSSRQPKMRSASVDTFGSSSEEDAYSFSSSDSSSSDTDSDSMPLTAEALAESFLASIVVECGGSPHEIADRLVAAFSVEAHPYRPMLARRLEESHCRQYLELSTLNAANTYDAAQRRRKARRGDAQPLDFAPFVDILLSLYYGREVELLLTLCPEHTVAAADGHRQSDCWLVAGAEGGEHYYYSSVPEFSQWERPAAMA